MMVWTVKDRRAHLDELGFIASFLDPFDMRPAREQLNSNYQHGGGWLPIPKFKLLADNSIQYSGDDPLRLLFEARLRDEIIRVYENAFVSITQPNGDFEVARMD